MSEQFITMTRDEKFAYCLQYCDYLICAQGIFEALFQRIKKLTEAGEVVRYKYISRMGYIMEYYAGHRLRLLFTPCPVTRFAKHARVKLGISCITCMKHLAE